MTALQWGNVIGYDILAFDKAGHSAFIEVKTTASYPRRWVLQKKYATPASDRIPIDRRFVCCVDVTHKDREPSIHVFPAAVVAKALQYFWSDKFPNSASYHLSLDFKPSGKTKVLSIKTVGEFIGSDDYLEAWGRIGVEPIQQ
jgi:hypothetical protein